MSGSHITLAPPLRQEDEEINQLRNAESIVVGAISALGTLRESWRWLCAMCYVLIKTTCK